MWVVTTVYTHFNTCTTMRGITLRYPKFFYSKGIVLLKNFIFRSLVKIDWWRVQTCQN